LAKSIYQVGAPLSLALDKKLNSSFMASRIELRINFDIVNFYHIFIIVPTY